jgi:PIN domain nuclease of toxin-antitoxin system
LDTHTFLWGYSDPKKLGRKAASAIADPKNEVFLSAASAWEMSLKVAKGNLTLPQPLGAMLEALEGRGLQHLPITWEHAVRLQSLPFHHRDPFDRLLASQAMVEGLTLVSADNAFKKYEVPLLW